MYIFPTLGVQTLVGGMARHFSRLRRESAAESEWTLSSLDVWSWISVENSGQQLRTRGAKGHIPSSCSHKCVLLHWALLESEIKGRAWVSQVPLRIATRKPILHCRAVLWQLAKTSTKLQTPIHCLSVGETIDIDGLNFVPNLWLCRLIFPREKVRVYRWDTLFFLTWKKN